VARYFGTNGIRGMLNSMTPAFAASMCAAFATWLRGGKILLGRDTRTSGAMLARAAAAGLSAAGCDVVDLGIVPSPTVEFEITRLGARGAVIVTASHNPPAWNGLKFVDANGIAVSRERGEEIEKIFEEKKFKIARWDDIRTVRTYSHAIRNHIDAVKQHVNANAIRSRSPFLVLDCANGTMGGVAPAMFRELGCRIVTLNANIDGAFPGRASEPTEANVADLIASVRALGADAGIAWDGDGDRVVFVDERGRWIIGDKVFALAVQIALAKKKGNIFTTVSTSRAIEDVTKRRGARVIYTKVGGPYLSEKIAELGGVIGGEEVGGVIWPELHLGKDGLMTAAKIVERMCKTPLSRMVDALPRYFNAKTKIECTPEQKTQIIEKIRQAALGRGRITDIDGIRIDFDSSWVIVRASGTENYVRIFAEARTQHRADALMHEYAKLVAAVKR